MVKAKWPIIEAQIARAFYLKLEKAEDALAAVANHRSPIYYGLKGEQLYQKAVDLAIQALKDIEQIPWPEVETEETPIGIQNPDL